MNYPCIAGLVVALHFYMQKAVLEAVFSNLHFNIRQLFNIEINFRRINVWGNT